jgi:hypothetical protein
MGRIGRDRTNGNNGALFQEIYDPGSVGWEYRSNGRVEVARRAKSTEPVQQNPFPKKAAYM